MAYRKKIIILIFGLAGIAILAAGLFFYLIKNKNKPLLDISGAVVPHHNLVADQRANFFSELSKHIASPKTIILLSPNHYSAGQGNIQTTNQNWHLNQGQITADQNVISSLVKNNLAVNEPASFIDEHGIYNILADIHNNFPKAKLVPLIFENTSTNQLKKLEQSLLNSCPQCLMVASVDFSHYQPAVLSQLHDDRSIRDLQALDMTDILTNAEVDSGSALALLTMWANDHNTPHFTLQNHTNSGIIAQNPDLESTTHIFGWYESGDRVSPEQSVSFIIGGDMMFARGIYHKFSSNFNDAVIQLGDRVFWGTDAAIINLEGVITNKTIKDNIQFDNLDFRFSPQIVRALSFLHINAVSQANNHSYGVPEDITATRSLLDTAHIQSFGGFTGSSMSRVAYFQGNGISLTIIGVNMTLPGQKAEALIPIITELKKDSAMRVIIIPHWGEEYVLKHTSSQESAAHIWIDAGANMVIGGHPHVIEDAELYKGAPIIYSLGNLLFDQLFSQSVQEGLLIAGKFTSDGLTFFALPIQSINYQPRLMIGERKKEILNSLYIPFINYLNNDIIKI